ncbi:MAG: hypothetical protein K2G15_07980, partial [Muribaculaceae bacterium]|nr:hypothetical protein [Muribaculaceae bacterium]
MFVRRAVIGLLMMFMAVGWGVTELHKPLPLAVTGDGRYSASVLHSWETDGNALMGIVKVDSVNRSSVAPFTITVQM